MIRYIEKKDIPSIVWCLQLLRAESPTYRYVADDPVFVQKNLETLFDGGAFGVICNDVDCSGFMFGIASNPWYSRDVEAAEMLLYVKPEYRNQGLAPELIVAFEKACRERGAGKLQVGASIGVDDRRVEGMYEALGYKWIGRTLTKEF